MRPAVWSSRPIKALAAAIVVLAAVASDSSWAAPRTIIEVFPGPNAITNALAGAIAGDTLNIHTGNYGEHFTVSKNDMVLQAAGDGPVTVDGGCASTWTITVTGDGVSIHRLEVIGGAFGSMTFTGVDGGGVTGSTVSDTCGSAEYGINVYRSGNLKVIGNRASGFSDAGVYIGAITFGSSMIKRNDTLRNDRGIIVENSGGATIMVISNKAHGNLETGIWITNSDGVTVRGNMVTNNHDTGIQLDPLSDNNTVTLNTVSGHLFDLSNDGGTGNCWLDNVYTTSRGDISC
jgi:parallel beta-helix repeat protein